MKILALVAHPSIDNSRVNRRWTEALKAGELATVQDLTHAYPDMNIDVLREQELLLAHDRIVL